jgi:hypothetical protein
MAKHQDAHSYPGIKNIHIIYEYLAQLIPTEIGFFANWPYLWILE